MKNKKGFTLVELLAVIAILAILVIISLPNVLQMFNNAKLNTFGTEVQAIYKQVETDFLQDNLYDSGPRFYCSGNRTGKNGKSSSDCKNLNMTTTKEYYVEVDSNGTITYIGVKDKSYIYSKNNPGTVNDIKKEDIIDISLADSTDLIPDSNLQDDDDEILADNIKCKRAKTLHTEICNNTPCDSKYGIGNVVTYGNDPTTRIDGVLEVGDAFDCKVSTNGGFTERFYYISDYYNTETNSFDSNVATLIYYANTYNGNADDGTNTDAYSNTTNNCNNGRGPTYAISKHLPKASVWDNISLQNNGKRKLFSCYAAENSYDFACNTIYTTAYNGRCGITNPLVYSTTSRLLHLKELYNGCHGTLKIQDNGGLDKCSFLYENSIYTNPNISTYYLHVWLETPEYVNKGKVFTYNPRNGRADYNNYSVKGNTRPVIDIPKSDIAY